MAILQINFKQPITQVSNSIFTAYILTQNSISKMIYSGIDGDFITEKYNEIRSFINKVVFGIEK